MDTVVNVKLQRTNYVSIWSFLVLIVKIRF